MNVLRRLAFLALLSAFMAVPMGCVPGTDGLRQACANANITLTQTTLTGTAIYKLAHEELRQRLTKANADDSEKTALLFDGAFDKFREGMRLITAVKVTVCDSADAIDAGAKRNIPLLTAQAGKCIIDAAAALAELQKIIDSSKKTSEINHLVRLAAYYEPPAFAVPRMAVL